jgi:hypothetical protein
MAADTYGLVLCGLAVLTVFVGLGRSAGSWLIERILLILVAALWAGALALFLTDNSVGHECVSADHSGERPALVVALAWLVMLTAFSAFEPIRVGLSGRVGRLALPVMNLVVIGGSLATLTQVQTTGC